MNLNPSTTVYYYEYKYSMDAVNHLMSVIVVVHVTVLFIDILLTEYACIVNLNLLRVKLK